MKPIIVTSGQLFTDIDAYACAIAYQELLQKEGKLAEVVLPGILNTSISKTILSWGVSINTIPTFYDYNSVIVDVSELTHIAKCAPLDSIIELFDHRYGFINFWQEKLGAHSHIEFVGSCTTLIWEEFKKRGYSESISTLSANLLYMGTVSNTLDFKAQVTTPRDMLACKELERYIDLKSDWKENYFKEQEESLLQDIKTAVQSDTKVIEIPDTEYKIVMGQVEMWNGSDFVQDNQQILEESVRDFNFPHWFVSIPSISENRNYIFTKSDFVKELLMKILPVVFDGDIGITNNLWLRKEIRKELFAYFKNTL